MYPPCSIAVFPMDGISPRRCKNLLVHLNEPIRKLKLSKVTFGLDLFCETPEKCELLFQMIIQNLFAPSGTMSSAIKLCKDLEVKRNENRSSRHRRIGKSRTVSECGPGNKGDRGFKSFHAIDRVRLGYAAKREVLKQRGLNTLEDLIYDPQFYSIIEDKWKFKQFTQNGLPKPSEYKTKGSDAECFFQIYLIERKNNPNLSRKTEIIPEFSALDDQLLDAAVEFDELWWE